MPHVIGLRPDDPRRIGRYRLIGRVAGAAGTREGGSTAFVAERADGQAVAVTVLRAGRAAGAAARDRFTAEARAARQVPPFCVAQILDGGFSGSRPYLVSSYVAGPSLAEILDVEGVLPPGTVAALAVGCAAGLAALHQTGLVHGQFGPERVVLSPDGPKVVEFGITPPYGTATPAADMLAWAQTMLAAAGAGPPTAGPGLAGLPPELAGLPAELATAVAGCLNPDPAERPTARDVLAGLLPGVPGGAGDAGLLAEASRLASAAAHPAGEMAGQDHKSAGRDRDRTRDRRDQPRDRRGRASAARSRAVLWSVAAVVCLAIIGVVAASYLGRRHAAPSVAITMTPVPDRSPPSPGALAGVPAGFSGTWSGTIRQNQPSVLTLAVRLTLAAGSRSGTIAYPGQGCAGTLALLSGGTGGLTLRQTISSGRQSCENGLISLAPRPDGKLSFTFQGQGGVIPTGLLSRGR
jgi:eukaryotic-like serine/threonine-protein kinase